MRASLLTLTVAALLAAAAGCGSGDEPAGQPEPGGATAGEPGAPELPQGSEPVTLDPADFVPVIDNPYWPMTPGTTWVYREVDEEGNEQRVEVTVTNETKTILGIKATVVHDVVSVGGEPIEVTDDWYAQDRWGNVWYLGEDTKEYENGEVVSTEGSFEAGVDGAQAGVIMPGDPQVGLAYRQEYYEGEAEDAGKILSLDATAEVPYGSFDGVLETEDVNPLAPDSVENKFYAKGVGPVLTVGVSGGSREELVSFEPGA
jgi:hypothetical protein